MNRNYSLKFRKKVLNEMKSLRKIYSKLKEYLIYEKGYVCVSSCNNDTSEYLVPKGTEDQITYYSKPEGSVRYSDHWNWYASINKCSDPDYIQCYNEDMPDPEPRISEKASFPWWGGAIAVYTNGSYKTLAGNSCYKFYKPSFTLLKKSVDNYIW